MSYQRKFLYNIDKKWLLSHDTELNDAWPFIVKDYEDAKEKAKELNEILNTVGFSAHIYEGETINILVIGMDKIKYKSVTTRGAGRKKDWTKRLKYNHYPTLAQINELHEAGWKNRKIIEWIGCSEANFYKYMRRAKRIKADPEMYLFDL